jgi:hypothetical protein
VVRGRQLSNEQAVHFRPGWERARRLEGGGSQASGLVLKALRLLNHSTLDARVIKKKKKFVLVGKGG